MSSQKGWPMRMLWERGRATSRGRQPSRGARLDTKLSLLEAKLAESQNQQLAMEALYQELTRTRDEATLEEVEQLLLIANQQLQLANNVKAALIAMQEADARLQRIDRPQLSSLRKVLSNGYGSSQSCAICGYGRRQYTPGQSRRFGRYVAAGNGTSPPEPGFSQSQIPVTEIYGSVRCMKRGRT